MLLFRFLKSNEAKKWVIAKETQIVYPKKTVVASPGDHIPPANTSPGVLLGIMSTSGEQSEQTAAPEITEEFEYKANPAFVENCDKTFSRFKFNAFSEFGAKSLQSENHQKRIALMRKELLHFIKETEWAYEPVEKSLGQS